MRVVKIDYTGSGLLIYWCWSTDWDTKGILSGYRGQSKRSTTKRKTRTTKGNNGMSLYRKDSIALSLDKVETMYQS